MSKKKPSIEIKKNNNENNVSLVRRFSRRVQETSMMPIVKGKRYASRKTSKLTQKKKALKKIVRRKENDKLRKLGKIG